MLRSLYAVLNLLIEAGAARRDARVRFLKAQVEILRRKLGGNRVIPSPDDRIRLLAIGAELKHEVADVIGIVTPQTYSRWVVELRVLAGMCVEEAAHVLNVSTNSVERDWLMGKLWLRRELGET